MRLNSFDSCGYFVIVCLILWPTSSDFLLILDFPCVSVFAFGLCCCGLFCHRLDHIVIMATHKT